MRWNSQRGCQREVSFATHNRAHIPMVVRMSKRVRGGNVRVTLY